MRYGPVASAASSLLASSGAFRSQRRTTRACMVVLIDIAPADRYVLTERDRAPVLQPGESLPGQIARRVLQVQRPGGRRGGSADTARQHYADPSHATGRASRHRRIRPRRPAPRPGRARSRLRPSRIAAAARHRRVPGMARTCGPPESAGRRRAGRGAGAYAGEWRRLVSSLIDSRERTPNGHNHTKHTRVWRGACARRSRRRYSNLHVMYVFFLGATTPCGHEPPLGAS